MIPAGGHLSTEVFDPPSWAGCSILFQQCVYPGLFVELCATYHLSGGTYADTVTWRLGGISSWAESVSTKVTKPEILGSIMLTRSKQRSFHWPSKLQCKLGNCKSSIQSTFMMSTIFCMRKKSHFFLPLLSYETLLPITLPQK